jgi:hypothetical protein
LSAAKDGYVLSKENNRNYLCRMLFDLSGKRLINSHYGSTTLFFGANMILLSPDDQEAVRRRLCQALCWYIFEKKKMAFPSFNNHTRGGSQ